MGLYKGTKLIAGSLPIPAGAMTYKGTCLQAELPTIGQLKGDYYKLSDSSGTYQGQCAIWNGSSWDYSTANVSVDSTIDSKSRNPVENQAISKALSSKVDKIDGKDLFSGSYNDLTDKPKFDYLPLTGGLMSGIITVTGDAWSLGKIVNNLNSSGWAICGGTDKDSGASLSIIGKDLGEGWGGQFILRASNGSKSCSLVGKPDKTLTWDDKKVITDDYEDITSSYFQNSRLTGYKKAVRTGNVISVAVNGGGWTNGNIFTMAYKYRPKGHMTMCVTAVDYPSGATCLLQLQGDTGNAVAYGSESGNWYWSCTYVMEGE